MHKMLGAMSVTLVNKSFYLHYTKRVGCMGIFQTYHMKSWSIVAKVVHKPSYCYENKHFLLEDLNIPEFITLC